MNVKKKKIKIARENFNESRCNEIQQFRNVTRLDDSAGSNT